MKRILAILLALALVLTLAASAAAGPQVLYAVRDGVKVYASANTQSTVYKTLSRGDVVLVEDTIVGWYAMLVQDPNSEGQVLGWIRAADLSTTPPCNHNWGDWVVLVQASCTKKGLKQRVCKLCGEKEQQEIDKIAHSYGSWFTQREPTCTKAGEEARWCQVCGYEQTRAIDKLPHNYGPWSITLEATDHSAGIRARTCRDCGRVQEKSFDPEGTLRRGDKGAAVKEIQQLLVEQGYLDKKKADGSFGSGTEKAIIKFQKDQGITPDGVAWPETIRRLHHDFGDWEVVTELTRFTDGEMIRVCTECGYTEHRYSTATPFFTRGDKENGVKTIQKILSGLGYDCGEADGSFGGKLERAWESFALEKGLTPELDRLRPGDLDLLTNEWIDNLPEGAWRGQGNKDAAVNLILTIRPAGESNGVRTYDWTLSNLGAHKCRFVALVYAFGAEPDYTADVQVALIDYARLKADGENRLTGSFSVPYDWTETLSFCAVATEDETGAVWLSNSLSFGVNA